ncbi:hypothetical protein M9Y10_030305 [Tritrichomonas musculus]|uniref:Uncharacterized protein n=1 Tax=Tritrichomonas musculus TaxID=1915356 RepID=A0ABR2KQM8_9EUKA
MAYQDEDPLSMFQNEETSCADLDYSFYDNDPDYLLHLPDLNMFQNSYCTQSTEDTSFMEDMSYLNHPQNCINMQSSQLSEETSPKTSIMYSNNPQNCPNMQSSQLSEETSPQTNIIYSNNPQNCPNIQSSQLSEETSPQTNIIYSNNPQNCPNIQSSQLSEETHPTTSASYSMDPNNSSANFCMTNTTPSNISRSYTCLTARSEDSNTPSLPSSGFGYQVSGQKERTSRSFSNFFYCLYNCKRFPKECIYELHNIVVDILIEQGIKTGMKKCTRDEKRTKERYFQNNYNFYDYFETYVTKDMAKKVLEEVRNKKKKKKNKIK